MGLYDGYKAINSTVIPMYVGSTVPEITKLFEAQQNKFDQGYAEDAEYADKFNNLPTPFNDADKQTMLEMNKQVQAAYKERMARGDYENTYRDVEKGAREMATKIKPIMDVMAADAAYQEKIDKSNLSPEDKNALLDMARTGYEGMKWDANGRPTSVYAPPAFVDNVDVLKILQDRLQILHASGSQVVTHGDDGYSITDHGQKISGIDGKVVAALYDSIVNGDESVRASNAQNVKLKAWAFNKGLNDKNSMELLNQMPDKITVKDEKGKDVQKDNDVKIKLMSALKDHTPTEVMSYYNTMMIAQKQEDYQRTYALGKAYTETERMDKWGIGDIEKHAATSAIDEASQKRIIDYKNEQDKLKADEILPGFIPVDGGKVGSWKDFSTTMKADSDQLAKVRNDNQAQRNVIATALKIDPKNLTDKMINTYFESHGLAESQARYNNNVQTENDLNTKRQENINMIKQLDDRVLNTKEFDYTTLKDVRTKQNEAIVGALNADPNKTTKVQVYSNYNDFVTGKPTKNRGFSTTAVKNPFGNYTERTNKQIAQQLEGATIERTEKGGLNTERTVTYKLKDGSYMTLSDSHATGKLDTEISNAADFGQKLEKAKQKLYEDDVTFSNQTIPTVVMSKERTEQMKREIQASNSMNITTLTGASEAGNDKLRKSITSGQYEVLAATKANKVGNDNTAGVISMLDDKGKPTGEQYIVNYSSTSALKLSDDLFRTGTRRRDGTFIKTSRMFDPNDGISNFFNKSKKETIYIRNGKKEIIGRIDRTQIDGVPDIKVYDKNGNWDKSIQNNESDAIDYLHHLIENDGAHVDGYNPVVDEPKKN